MNFESANVVTLPFKKSTTFQDTNLTLNKRIISTNNNNEQFQKLN